MKKKRRSGFQPNAFSGYTEYRYGPTQPVSLAPILKGKRREHVVHQVIDVLKRWHLSPFEHEADAVHGLRQGLCLDGHGFYRAEADAFAIVAEGLRIIGAERPSWEQGQRQYADAADACRWCGQPLPEAATAGNRNSSYCSDVCGETAFAMRFETDLQRSKAAYNSALRAARRRSMPERPCGHCGTPFRPLDEAQTYCCLECSNAARRTLPESACLTCGKVTRWDISHRERKYCSIKCYGARTLVASIEKRCLLCDEPFMATSDRAQFCCEAHAKKVRNVRRDIRAAEINNKPLRISPPVFDYVFKMAA